ncbi:MAG: aminotransferase class III-fold pyridoxal phosphate-dependent enzyme, partial [Alphaproteobacteria bacterium]
PNSQSKIFLGNSGSDANDTQIKMVWYYNNALGRPKKKKIISRLRAYHGVTIGAASLTGLPAQHTDFDAPAIPVVRTDCPHYYRGAAEGESEADFVDRIVGNLARQIEEEGPDTIAAFIAEPVMGAGGVVPPPTGYFEKVQALLKEHDILFIDDEVICGFGRTGNMFGCETYGINPDTMSMAKALSSAYLPISAVSVPDEMFEAMVRQSEKIGVFGHGYTYSGHPVAAAVALRTLELMEERDVLGHVRSVAPLFQSRLQALGEHPLVGEARGVGLVGAVELVADKATKQAFDPKAAVGPKLMSIALEHGLICRAMVDNIGICPPLVITEEEINMLFDRLEAALNDTEKWARSEGLL